MTILFSNKGGYYSCIYALILSITLFSNIALYYSVLIPLALVQYNKQKYCHEDGFCIYDYNITVLFSTIGCIEY